MKEIEEAKGFIRGGRGVEIGLGVGEEWVSFDSSNRKKTESKVEFLIRVNGAWQRFGMR